MLVGREEAGVRYSGLSRVTICHGGNIRRTLVRKAPSGRMKKKDKKTFLGYLTTNAAHPPNE